MDSFLASIRPRLEAEPDSDVILVTGNESADLDSVVAALTTSFFLSRLAAHRNSIVLPYINIPKVDLALRSDIEYVLSSNHINHDQLFFRDQLPVLEQLVSNNKLSLFLVDHNKLAGTMSTLEKASVVGVIDHHADEKLYSQTATPRRIEVVGSCTSLVTDEFFKNALGDHHKHKSHFDREDHLQDQSRDQRDADVSGECHINEESNNNKKTPTWVQQVARLLMGPILIDTMDLNPEMNKVKPLDTAMAKLIFPYTGWKSMDELYNRIDDARKDTSKLSCYDLLRKDYKEWTVTQSSTGRDVKVGISSVIGLMDKYVQRDSKDVIQKAIDQWAKNRTLDLSLVLLADDLGEELGGYQRQVIVNPVMTSLKDVPEQMEKIGYLQLERTYQVDTDEFMKRGGRAYLQKNNTCTRKQIWPWVEKLLTQPPSTQSSNL